MNKTKKLGLYLHIPFCVRKCRYCDFYSAPADSEARSAYVDALIAHLIFEGKRLGDYSVDTVYFGGGTPNLLTGEDFARVLDTVKAHYHLEADAEITAECNPVAGDAERLFAMRAAGVNRLSIGLQSVHENELQLLGRPHDYAAFLDTFRTARDVGFENISVDLMFGIPAQTEKSFAKTLDAITSLAPEHISVYGLRIEKNTPFWGMREKLPLPDEDAEAYMAEYMVSFLPSRGYRHYEISNFAKEGFASRHNLRYWLGSDYLGFGPGAHSYLGGDRFETPGDTAAYLAAVREERFEDLRQNITRIEGKEKMDEYVMLRMRLAGGVDFTDFAQRFGTSFHRQYRIDPMLFEKGFLQRTDAGVAFTERGMRVSNAILSDWLDFGEE